MYSLMCAKAVGLFCASNVTDVTVQLEMVWVSHEKATNHAGLLLKSLLKHYYVFKLIVAWLLFGCIFMSSFLTRKWRKVTAVIRRVGGRIESSYVLFYIALMERLKIAHSSVFFCHDVMQSKPVHQNWAQKCRIKQYVSRCAEKFYECKLCQNHFNNHGG